MTVDPIPLATDDWPYLYLESRGIPTPYWVVLLIVVVIAAISTRKVFPAHRVSTGISSYWAGRSC